IVFSHRTISCPSAMTDDHSQHWQGCDARTSLASNDWVSRNSLVFVSGLLLPSRGTSLSPGVVARPFNIRAVLARHRLDDLPASTQLIPAAAVKVASQYAIAR